MRASRSCPRSIAERTNYNPKKVVVCYLLFTHTTWEFNDDGTVGSGHYTTADELRADYDNFASNYNNNDDFFDEPRSVTEWVMNSNGIYVNPNSSQIKGTYIGNVNEKGVVREWIGNVYWTSTNTGPLAGTKGLDNLNLIPLYVYYLPSGDTSFGDINGTEINTYLMELLSFSPDEKANMNAPPPSDTVFLSNSVKEKFIAMLKAAGIIGIARYASPLVIARAALSYSAIMANSDSSCNGTLNGCQSWLNSNYIGASTSKDKAEVQRERGVKPVDMVDLAAYYHDVAYDKIPAAGAESAIFDLRTLQADKDLLAACHLVVKMYDNLEVDPATGQNYSQIDPVTREKISIATVERAILVIEAFEIIVTEKVLRN